MFLILVFDLEYLISYIALQEPGPKHMFRNFFLHLDKISILYLFIYLFIWPLYYKKFHSESTILSMLR
jgi:hypothetical protein